MLGDLNVGEFALKEMFPSVVSALNGKSKNGGRRGFSTSKKPEDLRETSPDNPEERFEDLEDYIKTRLDIDSSLPLLKALERSVSI